MNTPANEEILGEDKGSPDGDCTLKGIRHADGTIEVTKVEYTPANEWSDAVEDIVRRIETLETDYIDGSYVSTSDAKKIGEDIQNLLDQHSAHLVERIESLKEDGETPFGSQELHETEVAHNQALDQAIDIVKSQSEKEIL
jgi:uncharacterized linocin/CFP29 family protein